MTQSQAKETAMPASFVICQSGKSTSRPNGGKQICCPSRYWYNSGHGGSHNFLTHEFVDALTHDRRPAIDVYESLAYTVPGIVAHDSAMQGGKLKKIPQFDRPEKT